MTKLIKYQFAYLAFNLHNFATSGIFVQFIQAFKENIDHTDDVEI